ncbi:MAG TPA: hypothetical protein DCZ92_02100 [Elusimicrobia bacterium]|nr:MAG: hypothetical protein A2016_08270 [Elusimicrobia bacterium GWF2_62_30]HBA59618.1 hypothetical protein [Elusimicrobiota bacterium]
MRKTCEHHALEKRKWVRLTRACNNRCLFCLDDAAQDGSFISFGEVARELRDGLKEGCRRAVLSGGEPLLHPQFVEIAGLASRLGYTHVQAICNGRMFCYKDLLARAAAAGLSEITFSLHGATPAQHDLLVGAKGAFVQTVAAIAAAVRTPGLIVSSDVVVNRLNVDQLGEIIRLLYHMGVREYDLLQVMPFGRAWENWKRLNYDPVKKKAALDRAFAWAAVPGTHIWTNRFPCAIFEGREEFIQNPSKLIDEIYGRREMLAAFLRAGDKPPCSGGRCRYCVLRLFCADLKELRAKGGLGPRPPALCAGAPRRPARGGIAAAADIMAIGEFFIKHRMTVKGAACRSCARAAECEGADIHYVIRRGFRALTPFPRAAGKKRPVK